MDSRTHTSPSPASRGYRLPDRLDGFQTDFSFTVGASFADPDHPAAFGAGYVFIENKFDHLAPPKIEIYSEPEAFLRRIDDEAGESLRVAVQIDDQTGASLRYGPL